MYLFLLFILPLFAEYTENPISDRLQWNENFGYCGETCFVTANLYYGQYCSQYTARAIASPGVPQEQEGSQLLLGVNDLSTADAMRLKVAPFENGDFFEWIKTQVQAGYPVALGLFVKGGEDDEYDHIVTDFASDDQDLYITDNGLYEPSGAPIYRLHFPFAEKTRDEANAIDALPYSIPTSPNCALAFTGIADEEKDTLPIHITLNRKDEPEPAAKIELTLTVEIPDPTQSYNLHYYKDFNNVPTSHFNSTGSPAQTWTIPPRPGTTSKYPYTFRLTILSNETAIFRAVLQTAP
jgi:hypothetical protein